jgi:PAS domain S-box-containing protein
MPERFANPEVRLRLAMAAARLGEWWTFGGEVINFSPRAAEIYGLKELSQPRAAIDAMIDPADREPVLALVDHAMEARHDFDVMYRVHRASDGRVVWVHGRGRAVYEDGRPVGLMGVVADVTWRRNREEEEKLRLREIEHRAKNVFMLIQGLLRMIPFQTRDQFVEAVGERVEALARAHDIIVRADADGVPLSELVAAELAAYYAPGRCVVHGPQARVTQAAAQPLGMLLHELATNSIKYGALATPEGRLNVEWHANGDGGLRLTWRERNLAASGQDPGQGERRGFGTVLMKGLAAQVGGSFSRTIERNRLLAELSIGPQFVRNHRARSRSAPRRDPPPDPPELADRRRRSNGDGQAASRR